MASITFDPAAHAYTLNGRAVPSVTQVIGDQLDDWSMVPASIREAALQLGRNVHEACALLLRRQLDWASLSAPLIPYVSAAERFLQQSGIRVLGSEVRVAHDGLGVAGTEDFFGEWGGRGLDLFDWKTGQLPRTVGPQTAAYQALHEETFGMRIRRRFCVVLNPDLINGYKVHELKDRTDWSYFLSALNCWRFKHG